MTPARQAVGQQFGRALRQKHLTTVRGAHDARGLVDDRAEVVALAPFDGADVQRATHPQWNAKRCRGIGQGALDRYRRMQPVERIVEGGVDAIASRLHDGAVVRLDRGAQERVVARQRGPHAVRVLRPQPGAPLDVGKEQGLDCRYVVHAKASRNHRCAAPTVRQRLGLDQPDGGSVVLPSDCPWVLSLCAHAQRQRRGAVVVTGHGGPCVHDRINAGRSCGKRGSSVPAARS